MLKNQIQFKLAAPRNLLRSLPDYTRQFILQSFNHTPIEVPVRYRGLTGSGFKNLCHGNVAILVNKLGGSQVSGYLLNEVDTEYGTATHFIFHSVWKTPEGNLVDVTANNFSSKPKSIAFLPTDFVAIIDSIRLDFFLPKKFKKEGIWVCLRDSAITFELESTIGGKVIRLEDGTITLALKWDIARNFLKKFVHEGSSLAVLHRGGFRSKTMISKKTIEQL